MDQKLPSAQAIQEALDTIAHAKSSQDLEQTRVEILGKKGWLTSAMRALGQAAPETRKEAGKTLNLCKQRLEAALESRKLALANVELQAALAQDRMDTTLPPREHPIGSLHPLGQAMEEATEILGQMGFKAVFGPHIEDDFHNFTALNIPPDHPARQEQDSFYFGAQGKGKGEPHLLRTHTSAAQIRAMQANKPPLQIFAPGRVFRADHDATHAPMFHQIEGLVINKTVTFAHLKGTLTDFCQSFFGNTRVPLRFRPSYFPFTEPSAEVDIAYRREGKELVIGEGDAWMEILGCGMVHPKVLENGGIDSEKWQGFAFGVGVERLAMLKYGIPDLRAFFAIDAAWSKHYGFSPLTMSSLLQGGVL